MSDETMTDTEESLYNEGFQQGLEEADPAETQENPQEETQEVIEGSETDQAEQETTGTDPAKSDKPTKPQ